MAKALFTPEEAEYIKNNYLLKKNNELAKELNTVFGRSITAQQIANYKAKNGLNSGLAGCYTPAALCEERMQGGYVMIKTGHGKRGWVYKHRYIWERAYGAIPKDKMLIFLDGDHKNCELSNLALISKAEWLEMARERLYGAEKSLTETGIAVAKLNIAIRERRTGIRCRELLSGKKKIRRKTSRRKWNKFTPEIEAFIAENGKHYRDAELSDMIDSSFGVCIPVSSIKKWKYAHGIYQQARWSEEMNERLKLLWKEHTASQCAGILNEEFSTDLNASTVSKHAAWLGLGKRNPKNRMTDEIADFMRCNANKYTNRELTELINEKFGTEFRDVSAYKTKLGLAKGEQI